MGAWIETNRHEHHQSQIYVAPYVGAWIETREAITRLQQVGVAPYVGAWIETQSKIRYFVASESHPTWVRGLKRRTYWRNRTAKEVAPYVGAWIETIGGLFGSSSSKSHPTWVRGLKLSIAAPLLSHIRSHPTWVRGLKLYFPTKFYLDTSVAPYVGAWIETSEFGV